MAEGPRAQRGPSTLGRCRVYARAAAWIAGADRWPERKWADLEEQVGFCGIKGEQGKNTATRPGLAGGIADHRPNSSRYRDPGWLGGRNKEWLS